MLAALPDRCINDLSPPLPPAASHVLVDKLLVVLAHLNPPPDYRRDVPPECNRDVTPTAPVVAVRPSPMASINRPSVPQPVQPTSPIVRHAPRIQKPQVCSGRV